MISESLGLQWIPILYNPRMPHHGWLCGLELMTYLTGLAAAYFDDYPLNASRTPLSRRSDCRWSSSTWALPRKQPSPLHLPRTGATWGPNPPQLTRFVPNRLQPSRRQAWTETQQVSLMATSTGCGRCVQDMLANLLGQPSRPIARL